MTLVTRRGPFDDRRIALALRGAREVCRSGYADAALMGALESCIAYLAEIEASERWELRLGELLALARRIVASATPPDLLDLSLVVDGDAWGQAARAAAGASPADEIAPLVRLLGDLGPRKPSRAWLTAVRTALNVTASERLLRRWLEIASAVDPVPEWPGSEIGYCRGTLFVGSNSDVVRASVWATTTLEAETWPVDLLARLASRGEAHNGMAGFPEALALKVASAAIDALVARGTTEDRAALALLHVTLQRRDLKKKIGAAIDPTTV